MFELTFCKPVWSVRVVCCIRPAVHSRWEPHFKLVISVAFWWAWPQRAGCLLFFPAASTRLYLLFLLALFVVAGGITILQVAANPYISVLGPEESASSRLNLSQAFNSFGTTLAPWWLQVFVGRPNLGKEAIEALSDADGWPIMQVKHRLCKFHLWSWRWHFLLWPGSSE